MAKDPLNHHVRYSESVEVAPKTSAPRASRATVGCDGRACRDGSLSGGSILPFHIVRSNSERGE